jgi:hypothetical protein
MYELAPFLFVTVFTLIYMAVHHTVISIKDLVNPI